MRQEGTAATASIFGWASPVGRGKSRGMKIPALCCAFLAAVLTAQTARAEKEPDTELGKQMEAMGKAFKEIRKETDPVKGAALARDAENALVKCLAETPKVLEKTPAAEKPKAVANYRTMIGELFVTFSKIEEAYLANDLEKVKTLAETAKGEKKDGHEKYTEKDKK